MSASGTAADRSVAEIERMARPEPTATGTPKSPGRLEEIKAEARFWAGLTHMHGFERFAKKVLAELEHIEQLEKALQELADDYDALCGDGKTWDSQPYVLKQARIALGDPRT
jgi:cell division protein FtsB